MQPNYEEILESQVIASSEVDTYRDPDHALKKREMEEFLRTEESLFNSHRPIGDYGMMDFV